MASGGKNQMPHARGDARYTTVGVAGPDDDGRGQHYLQSIAEVECFTPGGNTAWIEDFDEHELELVEEEKR